MKMDVEESVLALISTKHVILSIIPCHFFTMNAMPMLEMACQTFLSSNFVSVIFHRWVHILSAHTNTFHPGFVIPHLFHATMLHIIRRGFRGAPTHPIHRFLPSPGRNPGSVPDYSPIFCLCLFSHPIHLPMHLFI